MKVPIWTFSVTHLSLGVWGNPGSRGWVWGVMLVLRTFPELMGRSVEILVEIGPAVRAWKVDIGTNSHFYIYRLIQMSFQVLQCHARPMQHFCQYHILSSGSGAPSFSLLFFMKKMHSFRPWKSTHWPKKEFAKLFFSWSN